MTNPSNIIASEIQPPSQHTINTSVTLQLHSNPAYETKSLQSQHSFSTTLQVHSNPAYEGSTKLDIEQQEQLQQNTPEPTYEVIPTPSNQPVSDGQKLENTEGERHDYDVLNRGQSTTTKGGVASGVAVPQRNNSQDYSTLELKEGIKQIDNQ